MRWSMNSSPAISYRQAGGLVVSIALILLGAWPARAQDELEQRYQDAIEFFSSARMEDACELLQQVEKERPGYKQTSRYLNPACSQAKRMVQMEESLYNEGVQFLNQSRFDDAKQKFEQANKILLKNPKYRSQINRHLKEIDSRLNEDRLFDEGTKLFAEGKHAEARGRFSQVSQGGGPKAANAREYLAKIEEADRRQRAADEGLTVFNEGVRLFNAGKHAEAFISFDKVVKAGGPKAAEARSYLQRLEQITQAQKQPAKPPMGQQVAVSTPPPKPSEPAVVQPSTTPSRASEETLRAGLKAYFEGQIDEAERYLTDYLSNNGQKQSLAYFFRGAARSTRYYLSGEKDTKQKGLAGDDFRALRDRDGKFRPPEKFVSPKILALYSQAVGSTSQ